MPVDLTFDLCTSKKILSISLSLITVAFSHVLRNQEGDDQPRAKLGLSICLCARVVSDDVLH